VANSASRRVSEPDSGKSKSPERALTLASGQAAGTAESPGTPRHARKRVRPPKLPIRALRHLASTTQPPDSRLVLANSTSWWNFGPHLPLGEPFVYAAVSAVRLCANTEPIKEKTWWDNYVCRLDHFLGALAQSGFDPSNADDLHRFAHWYRARLAAGGCSGRTVSKLVHCTNKLIAVLVQSGAIPVNPWLDTGRKESRGSYGRAKGTVEVLGRFPQRPTAPMPGLLVLVLHGRPCDYAELKELGHKFVENIVSTLQRHPGSGGDSLAKQRNITLKSFLRSLLQQRKDGRFRPLFGAIDEQGIVSLAHEHAWDAAVHVWRDALYGAALEGKVKLITVHDHVRRLGELLGRLSAAALIPRISLRGFKKAKLKSHSRPRSTIAEATRIDARYNEVVDIVCGFLTPHLHPEEQYDARSFVRALAEELGPHAVRELSAPELIEAMHKLNASKISELDRSARALFMKWYRHWKEGQEALRAPGLLQGEALCDLFDSPLLSTTQKRKNVRKYLKEGPIEARLGNALQYVLTFAGGITSAMNGRLHHLQIDWGGRSRFQAYLHPHHEATLALWVIGMVDTGANCEVMRETPRDCLGPSDGSGWRRVDLGHKARARGKPIRDLVPELAEEEPQTITLVQAIEAYLRMSGRYAALSGGDAKNRLLLHEREREVRTVC